MSDCPLNEIEITESAEESHKVFKRAFIDEQEWYLYKYIEAEKQVLMKDRADPTLMASALNVRIKVARRPWYFVWNNFSLTVSSSCRTPFDSECCYTRLFFFSVADHLPVICHFCCWS